MLPSPTPPKMNRWVVSVTEETDRALRRFLGAQGMRKGDLSKFIVEAVQARIAQLTDQADAGAPPRGSGERRS